jgi:hypothetical protein
MNGLKVTQPVDNFLSNQRCPSSRHRESPTQNWAALFALPQSCWKSFGQGIKGMAAPVLLGVYREVTLPCVTARGLSHARLGL